MSSDIEKPKDSSLGLTVAQFCEYIAPSVWSDANILTWPPDVFAIAAALLSRSGAYSHAVSGWDREGKLQEWTERMKRIGADWSQKRNEVPEEVRGWYESLRAKGATLVQNLCADEELCCTLIQLCAAADEACLGVGRPLPPAIKSSPLRKDCLTAHSMTKWRPCARKFISLQSGSYPSFTHRKAASRFAR
jgi:hypothetical protein